jgi:hypothetical protein
VRRDPDVLAFDNGTKRLYVAAESGDVTVLHELNQTLEPEAGMTCRKKPRILRAFLSVHRDVERCKKNPFEVLDIRQWCSKITNGSVPPKGVGPCRGFTVGSEVIQGTDPIVRRLISTG